MSVVLADRATFPRDKPCGGGLTTRAFLQSPVDPTPVVEEEVDLVELRFRYGASVERRAHAPVIRMTQRRRLDAFLLGAAREAGVTSARACASSSARRCGSTGSRSRQVSLSARTGPMASARADSVSGTTSSVALRSRGMSRRPRRTRALQAAGGDRVRRHSWRLRVGVSERRPRQRGCRRVGEGGAELARSPPAVSAMRTGSPRTSSNDVRGHRLPLRRHTTRIVSGRALLVGDAAGLIDPVSGDGMYECFVSASAREPGRSSNCWSGRASNLDPYAHGARRFAFVRCTVRRGCLEAGARSRASAPAGALARTQLVWRSVEQLLLAELIAPRGAAWQWRACPCAGSSSSGVLKEAVPAGTQAVAWPGQAAVGRLSDNLDVRELDRQRPEVGGRKPAGGGVRKEERVGAAPAHNAKARSRHDRESSVCAA